MLKGWLCLNKNSKSVPTIVFFHENAGNIGTRLPFIKTYMERIQCNFLIVAYRGFSDSEGVPSEEGIV